MGTPVSTSGWVEEGVDRRKTPYRESCTSHGGRVDRPSVLSPSRGKVINGRNRCWTVTHLPYLQTPKVYRHVDPGTPYRLHRRN